MMQKHDIAVIGGGPAGMAAAIAAFDAGTKDVVILDREAKLGGILNQCIHNGFGLHTFKEELTGPEYAQRYIDKVLEKRISYKLNTIVINISQIDESGEMGTYQITAMNKEEGLFVIEAKAIILAMGCRERARGALNIPGYRPAGIYSAGTAQRYVNIEGKMPGKEVVILGSGDIGLIMARRMTLEGAKVKLVAELMPYSGGLKRNIVQCLDDFGIPLKLSHTVVDIQGKERVESVTIAKVDENRNPIKGTEEVIACDTLLLSCGLIPENELSHSAGVKMHPVTGGPVVNESLETNQSGIFACGNVLHVHDLVDYVSKEAKLAGENAAKYVLGDTVEGKTDIEIKTGKGIRYTVPSSLCIERMDDLQTIRFRVENVYKNCHISVKADGRELIKLKKPIVAPGEMEQVILKKQLLIDKGISKEIVIELAVE
jgi:NADPH-dependent 2,4-dienoyl-CoA reductase/sulfur reductase-like enzyme